MSVSGVSMVDSLAVLASGMQSTQLDSQLGVAVMKSIMDQQEQFAQALVQMIQQRPTLDGTGSIINIGV